MYVLMDLKSDTTCRKSGLFLPGFGQASTAHVIGTSRQLLNWLGLK